MKYRLCNTYGIVKLYERVKILKKMKKCVVKNRRCMKIC